MMFGLYVLLTLATLIVAAVASRSGGLKLWLALLVLGWTVSQFNTLLEAVVFSVMPLTDALVQLAVSAVAFALLAAVAVTLSWSWRGGDVHGARPNASRRDLALIILGYEFLYWTAGTLVWPFVAEFYSDKPLPALPLVAALQVPRALIFVIAAWPWLRTGPRHAPLVLGLAYSVIGGIAPMLPDNPYMPADVRLAHGIETSVSNFIFGILVGYLLRSRPNAGPIHRAEPDSIIKVRASNV
jgi:hypothetical protein